MPEEITIVTPSDLPTTRSTILPVAIGVVIGFTAYAALGAVAVKVKSAREKAAEEKVTQEVPVEA